MLHQQTFLKRWFENVNITL